MATRVPWFRKDQAMPTWLWLGERDGRDDNTFRYWIKIWYAQPKWAKRDKVAEVYAEAERLREEGHDVEVDHIVPLRSPRVCGLHCEHNLVVAPRKLNQQKRNHYWPGMHMEQLDLL